MGMTSQWLTSHKSEVGREDVFEEFLVWGNSQRVCSIRDPHNTGLI